VLAQEGVDLRDVIIGHSGDSTDLDYLMKVADQGSILGMDRFRMNILLPLQERVSRSPS
jgi:phosphotriesterase-related protein